MEVTLIAAVSADGFIAPKVSEVNEEKAYSDSTSTSWTSETDLEHYVSVISQADSIVIGSRTFKTFQRYPRGSHWIVYTRTPVEFVNPKPEVITAEATTESPQDLISRLQDEGKEKVVISGGASIYTQFIEARVVDYVHLSVHPLLFGEGVKLLNAALSETLNLVDCKKLKDNQTVLLVYEFK